MKPVTSAVQTLSLLAFSTVAAGICAAQDASAPVAASPAESSAAPFDAFAEATRMEDKARREGDPRITLLSEFIEIAQADWSRLSRDPELGTEGPDLRKHLSGMMKSGHATLVDMNLVSGISGDSVLSHSFRFHIYPSEFEPPRIDETNGRIVPAAFSASECWAAGCRISGEASVAGEGRVRLRIAPEIVEKSGDGLAGQEEAEVPLPSFFVQKIYSDLDVATGEPTLAGVMRSLRPGREEAVLLVFLRADVHNPMSAVQQPQ